jgi:hypothetical protein
MALIAEGRVNKQVASESGTVEQPIKAHPGASHDEDGSHVGGAAGAHPGQDRHAFRSR